SKRAGPARVNRDNRVRIEAPRCRERGTEAGARRCDGGLMEQRIQPASSAPEPAVGLSNVDRSERELSCLAELAHAQATSRHAAEVLDRLVDRLRMLQGAQAAAVLALTPEADELEVEAVQPPALGARVRGRRFAREGAWVDRALREARPVPVHPASPAARDALVQALLEGRPLES